MTPCGLLENYGGQGSVFSRNYDRCKSD